jgi:hypothetical protein
VADGSCRPRSADRRGAADRVGRGARAATRRRRRRAAACFPVYRSYLPTAASTSTRRSRGARRAPDLGHAFDALGPCWPTRGTGRARSSRPAGW